MQVHVCQGMNVELGRQVVGISSFHPVGLRDETQVLSLSSK